MTHPQAIDAAGGGAPERHVLCVDDDVEFLRSLEFFLPAQVNHVQQDLWYRFAFFDDPAEALDVLREMTTEGEPVAMLISDQMMPAMKGTEFLGRAREVSEDAVRVLLTGHAGIESAITAINEHLLDRYLTKPVESEQEFTLNVRQLLQKYEMRRTIHDQGRRIHELYDFANTLNAEESLAATLQSVATFTSRALQCQHVRVLVGPEGQERVATAGRSGPSLPMQLRVDGRAEALAQLGESPVGTATSFADVPILEANGAGAQAGGILYGVLRADAELFGAIVATGPAGGAFDQTQSEMMKYIASTASVAVHNQVNRSKLQDAWAETRLQAVSLAEANGRLRILDQLKSDFLGFISHELRTPLSYLSAAQMIGEVESPHDQREMAQIVKRGYERLERFISKGLEYFSWIAASRDMGEETTDLADVLREVIAEFAADGAAPDLSLAASEPACARIGKAPAVEIARVLLDNAIKFSSGKPVVRVSVEAGPARVQLMVQDRGRGFPHEWAGELFQPFTIVESMRHKEGTALSLAKVAAIVQAHGGEIRAHSAGLGQGATFIVELPAAGSEREAETARVSRLAA